MNAHFRPYKDTDFAEVANNMSEADRLEVSLSHGYTAHEALIRACSNLVEPGKTVDLIIYIGPFFAFSKTFSINEKSCDPFFFIGVGTQTNTKSDFNTSSIEFIDFKGFLS